MSSVNDVISFLRSVDGFQTIWPGTTEWLSREIVGINTDQEAREGELAWISPRQVGANLDRISSFKGSLLIGPKEALSQKVPVIVCDKPKLAFIHVVDRFFHELTRTTWPKPGEYLLPNTKLSEDVILSAGVIVGSGVTVESDVVIGPNTVVANCTIKRGVHIGANCTIGLPGFGFEKDEDGRYWRFPHIGRVIIEEDVEIGSNTCIDRGSIGDTVIGRGTKVDNLVHVAHNVRIGPNAIVIANSMLGGSATIEDNVWVAPSVSVMNQVSIGRSAILGMGAVVLKDVEELSVMVGNPAKLLRKREDRG